MLEAFGERAILIVRDAQGVPVSGLYFRDRRCRCTRATTCARELAATTSSTGS